MHGQLKRVPRYDEDQEEEKENEDPMELPIDITEPLYRLAVYRLAMYRLASAQVSYWMNTSNFYKSISHYYGSLRKAVPLTISFGRKLVFFL